MKTKNVMLAVFVFVFALGSAFVSIKVEGPDDQHVNDPSLGARDIMDVDCGQGQVLCRVEIDGQIYQVYEDQTLETAVKGSETDPIPTSFE